MFLYRFTDLVCLLTICIYVAIFRLTGIFFCGINQRTGMILPFSDSEEKETA